MRYYPEFTRLLHQYLERADRSATWLAKQLGVNPSTVTRWLNYEARPSKPEQISRIADVLGIASASERQLLFAAAGYPAPQLLLAADNAAALLFSNVGEADKNSRPAPFMVPAPPPHGVFGRADLLARLAGLLALNHSEAVDIPPVALHGMGGIGKTTLAITLGRWERTDTFFPDGVLWAAIGPNPTIRMLLDDWGRALGVDLVAERNEEACRERLRSLLHYRRVLLIIDDVWEVAHGQYFTVAGPRCRTLFTTRETPIAYALATRGRTLRVDVLKPEDALAMLRRLVPEAVHADVQNANRLCERLEYLPLALTLAGRMLANEADVPSRMQRLLDELIEHRAARLQLLQVEGRLGLGEEQPVSLQAILGLSVERLSIVEQKRFAMLAVFGAEPLTWQIDAAAYVWECSLEEAEATLARLIQRGLVARRDDLYWMHALLADYAAEMMERMNL